MRASLLALALLAGSAWAQDPALEKRVTALEQGTPSTAPASVPVTLQAFGKTYRGTLAAEG